MLVGRKGHHSCFCNRGAKRNVTRFSANPGGVPVFADSRRGVARTAPAGMLPAVAFDYSPAALDREFPVRKSLAYFNHAAVAPLPRRVSDAIVRQTENVRDRGAADWRAWYAGIEAARAAAARFVGARASEISFLPSTTWGLSLVAQSFAWEPGDNVVGDDMEFPSNVYPWMLLERKGVEHRRAKSQDGRVTLDDIAAAVDTRTRVVAISWVAFHNGWVFPLDEIGRFCREREILLVVDAIQGLGALPLDVASTAVDVLVADAHKWLLGPESCAIFYVAESARERLPPPFAGWWNIRTEKSFLDYELDFFPGGRRYEPGTLPTPQIFGLASSLELLEEMGRTTVLERILATNALLASGLEERGWKIASPALTSGILAAVPPKDTATVVAKRLESQGIIASPREGAVRFSPHAYNDYAEVRRIWQVVEGA